MERVIAKYLLDIKAVTLNADNPFKWSSGIIAPIYCDNRLTLSYHKIRKEVEIGLASLINEYFHDVDIIMGTATAGIAHAALVADLLELPMGYVRASNKAHGKGNQIEGAFKPGQKVVVVEDLISTGQSSLEVVKALRESKLEVLGVVSIFTYNLEQAKTNFENLNITYKSLSNYDTLIEVALDNNNISNDDFNKLIKWRLNPYSIDWMK